MATSIRGLVCDSRRRARLSSFHHRLLIDCETPDDGLVGFASLRTTDIASYPAQAPGVAGRGRLRGAAGDVAF